MNISKKIYKNSIYHLIKKNNLISYLIIISFFFLDRISKAKIIDHQLYNDQIYINDYINFDLVWNTGIGFGLFDMQASFFYHAISLLIFIIIIIILLIIVKCKNVEMFYYSMILGGALGNFYDRATYFAVPDFIDFHINNYHWFTFNIADIFISIGIFLLLLRQLTTGENEKN